MQFDNWRGKAKPDPCAGDDSDEEIRILQARIREKKMLKQTAKSASIPPDASNPQHWTPSLPVKAESKWFVIIIFNIVNVNGDDDDVTVIVISIVSSYYYYYYYYYLILFPLTCFEL